MLEVKGKTTDDRLVFGGIYKIYETRGIPLDVILGHFHNNNYMPCWVSLYDDCVKAGMKRERVIPKIETACADSLFGPEFAKEVGHRLEECVKLKLIQVPLALLVNATGC